jgi:hypothetical protein
MGSMRTLLAEALKERVRARRRYVEGREVIDISSFLENIQDREFRYWTERIKNDISRRSQ